jgi:hypothetical protein
MEIATELLKWARGTNLSDLGQIIISTGYHLSLTVKTLCLTQTLKNLCGGGILQIQTD